MGWKATIRAVIITWKHVFFIRNVKFSNHNHNDIFPINELRYKQNVHCFSNDLDEIFLMYFINWFSYQIVFSEFRVAAFNLKIFVIVRRYWILVRFRWQNGISCFICGFESFQVLWKGEPLLKKLVLIEYIFYICVDEFQEFPYHSCKDDKRNKGTDIL